jgi:hypothetical protein
MELGLGLRVELALALRGGRGWGWEGLGMAGAEPPSLLSPLVFVPYMACPHFDVYALLDFGCTGLGLSWIWPGAGAGWG